MIKIGLIITIVLFVLRHFALIDISFFGCLIPFIIGIIAYAVFLYFYCKM